MKHDDEIDATKAHRRRPERSPSIDRHAFAAPDRAGVPGKTTLASQLPPAAPAAVATRAVRAAHGAAVRVEGWAPMLAKGIAAADYLESGRLSFEIRSALRRAESALDELERIDPQHAAALAESIAEARARLATLRTELAALLEAAPVIEARDAGSDHAERAWRAGRSRSATGDANEDATSSHCANVLAGPYVVALHEGRANVPSTIAPSQMERSVIEAHRRGEDAGDRFSQVARLARWEADVADLAPRLGLGRATVHSDDEARAITDAEGARGVARGNVVYLHPERVRPGTPEGREVLAHELVHLAQARLPSAGIDADRDAAEREASELAPMVSRGSSAVVTRPIDLSRAAADEHGRDAAKTAADARRFEDRVADARQWLDATRTLLAVDVGDAPDRKRKHAVAADSSFEQAAAAIRSCEAAVVASFAAKPLARFDRSHEWAITQTLRAELQQLRPVVRRLVAQTYARNAVTGIHLWIKVKDSIRKRADGTLDWNAAGPGRTGPYKLYPHLAKGRLVFYVAFHVERAQNEWIVGADDADAFAAGVSLYAQTARHALPGSRHVENSQRDGADDSRLPSVLEMESLGQVAADGLDHADAKSRDPGTTKSSLGQFARDGVDHGNGGSAAVAAWNSHVRLAHYRKEAKRIANQIAADVESGTLDHLDARERAVEQRNEVMSLARKRMSPSAKYASSKIKSDDAVSVESMTEKKTEDLIKKAAREPDARRKLLADSEAWAKYIDDVQGERPLRIEKAVAELGSRPIVSKAIIESSGKTNGFVTGLAHVSRAGGGAFAAYGTVDMIATIADAEEGQRWHVAARELRGFTGGIIGGGMGSRGLVWVASILRVASGPLFLVVSVIGSIVGSILGSEAGRVVPRAVGQAANLAGKSVFPSSANAARGGFTGMLSKNLRSLGRDSVTARLKDHVFEMDRQVRVLERTIEQAKDRATLETLQRDRLELLEQRGIYDHLYGGLRSGVFTEAEVLSFVRDNNL